MKRLLIAGVALAALVNFSAHSPMLKLALVKRRHRFRQQSLGTATF